MTQVPTTPIQAVSSNIPDIIKAAATSNLGGIAYVFFKNEGAKVKLIRTVRGVGYEFGVG